MLLAILAQERPVRSVLTAASNCANHMRKPVLPVARPSAPLVLPSIRRSIQNLSQRPTAKILSAKRLRPVQRELPGGNVLPSAPSGEHARSVLNRSQRRALREEGVCQPTPDPAW